MSDEVGGASILWSDRARSDLFDIGDFIAHDKPDAAADFVETLMSAVARLRYFPDSGRIVPEFDVPDIREIIVRTYRIVYRRSPDTITVLTIFESRRPLRSVPSE